MYHVNRNNSIITIANATLGIPNDKFYQCTKRVVGGWGMASYHLL